ncbi:MAG: Response regulator of zinc sigma-54-dependent two-component system [Myxococcales bacterium]|nr:Response regulator of zinc sigma-54-dependent two-component system [Myxococcales bacterium]
MALPDTRATRLEPRIPFFTPVVSSNLHRCWTTNISSGGLGLAAVVPRTAVPERGDDIDLEFELGESKKVVRAVGRIAWTSLLHPDGRIGLGVQFRDISTSARADLALFLSQHRPRVIVALASPKEQALARSALGHVHTEFVDSPGEIDDESLRGCASIVVFSNDEMQLTGFLDGLRGHRADSASVPGELPISPITLCSALDSDVILPLVTESKVYEVLRPPFERQTLNLAVDRSCERWALQMELRWASLQLESFAQRPKPPSRAPELPSSSRVVRASAAMQRVYELIGTVAAHDVPVLLTGETGTGKEVAAREIHSLSKRAHTPFVAQDCGALTETLLETELFGHVRGAFTGANTDHAGLFQIADGGTIFLDEIQNTSPALQAKLLRVIEEGEIRPVGATKSRRIDVRLIAACNVDLRHAVKEQRFRADFFYRLNRFPIELPPLRDHVEDILPLVSHFVAYLCTSLDRPLPRIDPRAERALLAYHWPGNIRELRNVIERSLLLTSPGDPLRWDTLPDYLRDSTGTDRSEERNLDAQVSEFERRIIQMSLDRNTQVIRRAARELGVNAVTLARRMRRLGLLT